MGTRSLTIVRNFDNDIIVNIYRQMDGYPSVQGARLKEILSDMTIVNGISSYEPNMANGFNCLSAQLVAELKRGGRGDCEYKIGGIYLQPPSSWEDGGVSYQYEIMPPEDVEQDDYYSLGESDKMPMRGEDLHLAIYNWKDEKVYDGSFGEFNPVEVD